MRETRQKELSTLRNEDVSWLVNDMPAALGERGVAFDPSGGGGRTLADNWAFIERAHKAIPDVRRARRLMKIWAQLHPRHQNVFSAFYTSRQQIPTPGALAAFGEFAMVALLVSKDRPALVEALRDRHNSRHVPIVTAARVSAEAAVKSAHEEWERKAKKGHKSWALGGVEL